jgi:hypothetical protein
MKRILSLMTVLALIADPGSAGEDYHEPARGSAERAGLMDAVRPLAEWNLGQPVEFVVDVLRVSQGLGFATLQPQRPGGGAINLYQTPMMRRGGIDPEFYDGETMHVLYQKSGATWVAVHWSIGATDVWWADPELCATYRSVTPEYCF